MHKLLFQENREAQRQILQQANVNVSNAKKRSVRGWHFIKSGQFTGKCCPLKEKLQTK